MSFDYKQVQIPRSDSSNSFLIGLFFGFLLGLGVAAGAAMYGGWHWGWSGGGWGNSYTTVNVNRATNISANNFDANRYRDGQWQHDPAHRDGVPYRTQAERERYNQTRPGAQQEPQGARTIGERRRDRLKANLRDLVDRDRQHMGG